MTNKEMELPNKLYIEEKTGSNGYRCTDYYNYREQVAYTPENATRADERERVISEIEKMLGPKLVTLYQSELAIENYKSEFRAKLNSLKP